MRTFAACDQAQPGFVEIDLVAGGPEAQRAVGERSAGAAGRAALSGVPDPELVERPQRRRFTSEYKLRIMRKADGLSRPGDVGALLRCEGLNSSHPSTWRRQRDQGALEALSRLRRRKPAEEPPRRGERGAAPAPHAQRDRA